MRVTRYNRYGPPDQVLQIVDRAPQNPGPGQVRVRVRAAALNDWDLGLIAGDPVNRMINGVLRPRRVRTPGCELAGEVDAFEEIVQRWQGPLINLAWRFCRNHAFCTSCLGLVYNILGASTGWNRPA